MLDERFHEEINACRPGSHDIDEPEMSRLAEARVDDPALRARYEAVQQLDARLADAFAAVPVPSGLAARLLAGIQQAPAPAAADESLAASDRVAPDTILVTQASEGRVLSPAGRRHWVTRRRSLAALAASLLVATGLWAAFRSVATPAPSEMTTEAAVWYERLADQWQPIAEAPANLPIPATIVGDARGWQAATKVVGRRGVVYRLAQGRKHGPSYSSFPRGDPTCRPSFHSLRSRRPEG